MHHFAYHATLYLAASLSAAPPVISDAYQAQLRMHLLAAGSEVQGRASGVTPTTDRTPTIADGRVSGSGAVPRVSKTRCAFVTCEPQCNIKGIRDPQRGLIYRTPADPEYSQTHSEKVFCSSAEAAAAGYREDFHG